MSKATLAQHSRTTRTTTTSTNGSAIPKPSKGDRAGMVNVQVDFPPHLEARLQAKLRSEHLDRQTYLAGLIQRNLVRERERELFDSILHVCEIEGKGRHEAVGFDRAGSLVYCNGRTTKPITLKQSTQLVAKMSAAYSRNTDWLNENFDARTRVKWLRLVAAAVR